MLAGKKHLAVFAAELFPGRPIAEDTIPENAFAPYIMTRKISRYHQDVFSPQANAIIRYVCFAMKEHEWRAKTYLWIIGQTIANGIEIDEASETVIGRLLGYSEKDILQHLAAAKSAGKIRA